MKLKHSFPHLGFHAGWIGSVLLLTVQATPPLSNSLTGFTGNTAVPATQAALAAAGLEAASVGNESAVYFDASGAHFGTAAAGDSGRNYLRTVASDYATRSFVAEITMTFTSDDQQAFIGFGAGGVALFGTPDWSTQNSSVSFWPELANDKIVNFRTQNDVNQFSDTPAPGLGTGTHRFRMTFDLPGKTIIGALDMNYAGGAFAADVTTAPMNLTALFAADGWPSEPAKVFFGGDDGLVFRDLEITGDPTIPEAPAPVWLLGLGSLAIAARKRRACGLG